MNGALETSRRPFVGKVFFALLLAFASLALSAGSASAVGFADDFEDAGVFAGAKVSYEGMPGSLKNATRESGEPEHAGAAGKASAWISWTSSKNQIVEIGVCSAMDTVIGVYTGTAVNALTEVTGNDENSFFTGCGPTDAGVRFEAKSGTKYMIAVDTKDTQKSFNADLRTLPPNDNFVDAVEVPAELPFEASVDNRIATKETGEPDAGGYVRGDTVWYRWTAPKSGRVVVSTCIGESTSSGIGVYTGTAVNALAEVAGNAKAGGLCHNSSEAIFDAAEGTTYRIQVDGNGQYGELFLDVYWQTTREVAVTKSGSGEGTVSSEPAGIECGLVCSADFYRGPASDYWKTRVTLTATPAPGSAFVGWSGEGCSGTEPTCELVTEAASAEVDAEFEELPPLFAAATTGASSSSGPSSSGASSSGSPAVTTPKATSSSLRKPKKCAKGKKGKKRPKASKRRSPRCAKK